MNEEIARIVADIAGDIWPELQHNQSAMICKIIADWNRIRENGGGKGQLINARLDQHSIMLQMIMHRLGIVPLEADFSNCDNPPTDSE